MCMKSFDMLTNLFIFFLVITFRLIRIFRFLFRLIIIFSRFALLMWTAIVIRFGYIILKK